MSLHRTRCWFQFQHDRTAPILVERRPVTASGLQFHLSSARRQSQQRPALGCEGPSTSNPWVWDRLGRAAMPCVCGCVAPTMKWSREEEAASAAAAADMEEEV